MPRVRTPRGYLSAFARPPLRPAFFLWAVVPPWRAVSAGTALLAAPRGGAGGVGDPGGSFLRHALVLQGLVLLLVLDVGGLARHDNLLIFDSVRGPRTPAPRRRFHPVGGRPSITGTGRRACDSGRLPRARWGLRATGNHEARTGQEQGQRTEQEPLPGTRRGEVREGSQGQQSHQHPGADACNGTRHEPDREPGADEDERCGDAVQHDRQGAAHPEARGKPAFMGPPHAAAPKGAPAARSSWKRASAANPNVAAMAARWAMRVFFTAIFLRASEEGYFVRGSASSNLRRAEVPPRATGAGMKSVGNRTDRGAPAGPGGRRPQRRPRRRPRSQLPLRTIKTSITSPARGTARLRACPRRRGGRRGRHVRMVPTRGARIGRPRFVRTRRPTHASKEGLRTGRRVRMRERSGGGAVARLSPILALSRRSVSSTRWGTAAVRVSAAGRCVQRVPLNLVSMSRPARCFRPAVGREWEGSHPG